jgi:hypothetical protein
MTPLTTPLAKPAEHRFKATYTEGFLPAAMMFFLEFLESVLSLYRPEKHYMRGPGPAWRAKYGSFDDHSHSSHLRR